MTVHQKSEHGWNYVLIRLINFDSYSKYDKNDKHIYIHYKLCINVKISKSYKCLIYTNVQCITKYTLILIFLLHPLQLWWPLMPPMIVGGVHVSLGEWRWLVLRWSNRQTRQHQKRAIVTRNDANSTWIHTKSTSSPSAFTNIHN